MNEIMFSKSLHLYICMVFIATHIEISHQQKFIPRNKLSPINIQTSTVKTVNTEKPFTLYFETDDLEIVKNSGYAIDFYALPFARTHITGGLLGNKTFKVHRNYLTVNQNAEGRSGSEIDGKEFPVQGNVIFYNELYGTYENALNYADGLVKLSELVEVRRSKPNPQFDTLEKILLSGIIRKPNSSTVTSAKNLFQWYSNLDISHSYYAYEGTYYDPDTKKQVSRATCVVTQPPYNFISYEQHAAFKNVLGIDGEPINTIEPIYPQGLRKVQGANEVQAEELPFGEIVRLLQIGYLFLFGTST